MAQTVYWVRGLSDPASMMRIRHELLRLHDVESVTWAAGGLLCIRSASDAESLSYITSLCQREQPDATVARAPVTARFLPWLLWSGSLLLWLMAWLPVPLWLRMLCWAFSATLALAPSMLGGGALWKKQPIGAPWLPTIWLVLSFLTGHAMQGSLACWLYSVGAYLLEQRMQRLCRELSPAADDGKSVMMRRAQRATRLYTLVVAILGVAVGLLLPAISHQPLDNGLYRGLTLLVLASIGAWPLTVWLHLLCGQRAVERHGAALRRPRKVETLATARSIALDRQGTLVAEPLYVAAMHTLPDVNANMCVGLAAMLESHVDHPVARAIVAHAAHLAVEQTGDIELKDVHVLPSMGVTAHMAEYRVMCGNPHLLEQYDLVAENLPECAAYLVIDDRVIAAFEVRGELRPDAAEAVQRLRKQGLHPLALLTGDQPNSAEKTAVQVGIDKVYAGLLPESKLAVFRDMQRDHAPALFVGSGLYDIPTLTQADAGVALSCAPPEVRSAADVLLTTDELTALPRAIKICRDTLFRVKWIGRIALMVQTLAVISGAVGLLPLWGAALVDAGVAIGATLGLDDKA